MGAIGITINGAAGRMGLRLAELVHERDDLALISRWERAGHPSIGDSMYGCPVTAQWDGSVGDVIIDFSTDEGLLGLLAETGRLAIPLVSGTTGLSPDALRQLEQAGSRIPVFYSANMSTGIHVLKKLARLAAESLGPEWDVELVEMHHNRKIDSPSGTALALVDEVKNAWPEELHPVYGREGLGGPRKSGEMGVFALRGGDVIGEHELILAGSGETLRLKHTAISRDLFAAGALRAGSWLVGQKPGFYTMEDIRAGGPNRERRNGPH